MRLCLRSGALGCGVFGPVAGPFDRRAQIAVNVCCSYVAYRGAMCVACVGTQGIIGVELEICAIYHRYRFEVHMP